MAKFYGAIGYVETKETTPGVWTDTVTEYSYYGDVTRNARRLDGNDTINDNVNLNNIISIVSDPYALQHFFAIRYVKWMGASWKVSNVEVLSPRLILTVGGVYNGPEA
jgi:hypothetical protein